VQRQNCSATPHSRIHHLRSPNTKPTFFTLQKKNPLTALPIRRSANQNFATYAATSAAPNASRRVASRIPCVHRQRSRARARTEGQTDSREDRAVCCTTAWLSCDSMDTPRGEHAELS
jgi:hypothetical protein